jgi:hypothetical protein
MKYKITMGKLIIVSPARDTGISYINLDLNDISPGISVLDSIVFKNTIPISNSFQQNNAFTTTTVIIAGFDIGIIILVRTEKILHPSIYAASIISLGIVEKKLAIRKIPTGNSKPTYTMITLIGLLIRCNLCINTNRGIITTTGGNTIKEIVRLNKIFLPLNLKYTNA